MSDVTSQEDYDGFYFVPFREKEESGFNTYFFKYNDDSERGERIDSGSPLGDMWHVVFLKEDENGIFELDDNFEAILLEPHVYISHVMSLSNRTVYGGCVLRKTEKSDIWIKDYLTKILGRSMIKKLKEYAQTIGESNGKV
jgi:hypothetical protein